MIYAMTDLHGRFDLMNKALEEIEKRNPDTVIFLGDYIDRGPQSRQIIERLMDGPPRGWKWICLAGNHDRWFADIIRHHEHYSEWLIDCGGVTTMRSYGWEKGRAIDRNLVPKEHLDWIYGLPMYHETEHHVFVHAALDITKPMDQQTENMLTWGYWRGRDLAYNGKYIVHGHDSNPNGPIVYKNRINLDVRSFMTNRLCVGIFDGPGQPKEIIHIKGGKI